MSRAAALTCVLSLALINGGCAGRGDRVVVAGKNFTEQNILGEILAQQIESRTDLTVVRKFNLGGTLICHAGLMAGEIDIYVEYTGTALTAILGEPPSSDPQEVYELVRAAYARRFALEWLPPLGFDNSFALVIRGEDARRLNLRTISEAVVHARSWRPGFGYEFIERPDGLRGLEAAYNLRFGLPPRTMDLGLLYRALEEKQVDIVAGNATDGVIQALDLAVLEDDRHYFPPYEAAPVVRRATLERHPRLRAVLEELAGTVSPRTVRRLNYAVDGEGRDAAEVVREFRRTGDLASE